MSKLEPFKVLPVDFGKPTIFAPPSTENLIRRFIDEAKEVEVKDGDGNFNAHEFAQNLWEDSLSPSEAEEYKDICKAERAAREAYNPRSDEDTSPTAQAYFKADEAKEQFEREHGVHICFHCSYYTMPLKSNECAGCFKSKKSIRPYSLACRDYTNTRTPEDKALDEKERIWMAQHPHEAKLIADDRNRQAAERRAKWIDNGNGVAFFSYDAWPQEYEDSYRKYPEIFAKTKYPTFEEFKSAAETFLSKFNEENEEEETSANE